METTKPQLPTETWDQVISLLANPDQREVLQVSKQFHDLAIRHLFRTVQLYLLTEADASVLMRPPLVHTSLDVIDFERPLRDSWGIVQRILADEGFARNVREVCVAAYSSATGIEQYVLADVLRAFTRLEKLYWFGIWPEFGATADGISPCLQGLYLQETPDFELFSHLTNLVVYQSQFSLIASLPERIDDFYSQHDRPLQWESAIQVIESNFSTLEKLHIVPVHLQSDIFTRRFSSLLELDISIPTLAADNGSASPIEGIELAYRHMSRLQSLSFSGDVHGEALFHLPIDPSLLPNLTSFRIYSAHYVDAPNMMDGSPIIEFLRHRRNLRRFHLHFRHSSWDNLSLVLEEIGKMKKLEVLGYYVGDQDLLAHHYAEFASALPDTLKVLSLGLPWGLACNPNSLSPLLDRLASIQELSFFNLTFSSPWCPLEAVEIPEALPHIQTFGLQYQIWDVDRKMFGDARLIPWGSLKNHFYMDSDLPSEDAAWVYKIVRGW